MRTILNERDAPEGASLHTPIDIMTLFTIMSRKTGKDIPEHDKNRCTYAIKHVSLPHIKTLLYPRSFICGVIYPEPVITSFLMI